MLFSVFFPDLDVATSGENEQGALISARELLRESDVLGLKWEYRVLGRPIGRTPAFFILRYGSIPLNTVQKSLQYLSDVAPKVSVMWHQIVPPKSMVLVL